MRFIRDGHLSEVKTQQNESIRYTKTDFTPENIDLQIKLNWKFLLKLSLGLWKITSYALSITTSRILQGKPPLNSVEISLLVASALISCRSRRLRHRPLESLPNSKAEGRRILFRTVNRGLLSRVDSRTIISTRSRTPHRHNVSFCGQLLCNGPRRRGQLQRIVDWTWASHCHKLAFRLQPTSARLFIVLLKGQHSNGGELNISYNTI
jgi:hypothetical protein